MQCWASPQRFSMGVPSKSLHPGDRRHAGQEPQITNNSVTACSAGLRRCCRAQPLCFTVRLCAPGKSQAPYLVVTGAEVVWNGRRVSRALQQASHGIPACARKDYVKPDRDTLALGLLSNAVQHLADLSGRHSDATPAMVAIRRHSVCL